MNKVKTIRVKGKTAKKLRAIASHKSAKMKAISSAPKKDLSGLTPIG